MRIKLFNLWGSPVFYHGCQNQNKNRVRLFILTLSVEKSAFFELVIQNWEEIESLKNEKSSGIVLEFCFPISVRTLGSKGPNIFCIDLKVKL